MNIRSHINKVLGKLFSKTAAYKLCLFVVLSVVVSTSLVVPVGFADPLPKTEQEAINNYPNWVANNGCNDSSGGSVTTGSGLPGDVVKAINKLEPVYKKAGKAKNVPWQVLAAIHYREAGNNPNQDLQAGNPIGGGGSQFGTYTNGAPSSLEKSAEDAADELIAKAKEGVVKKPVNVAAPEPNAIKDALFGYNGRAAAYADQAAALGFNKNTQPYEGSPYVMNNYDKKHRNMKLITHDFGPADGVDTRLGAFTVYVKLGGATGGSADNCDGAGSGTVAAAIKKAIEYSWPDYHAPPYLNMKPAYKTAITKAIGNGEFVGGGLYPGIDCGGFVTRVMRDSGADPDYNWGPRSPNQGGTTQQQAYMNTYKEKYENLGIVNNTSKLQPGDIAINSAHTYMYVGKQQGFNGNSASSSYSETGLSWRAPMASNAYFSNFTWYRLKGGGAGVAS